MLKYFFLIPIVAHGGTAICLAMAFIAVGFVKKEVAPRRPDSDIIHSFG